MTLANIAYVYLILGLPVVAYRYVLYWHQMFKHGFKYGPPDLLDYAVGLTLFPCMWVLWLPIEIAAKVSPLRGDKDA